uniref:Uncharacterized protein n=1 Tax=Arundo donax TaxID=35708 RepID=A0A0A9C9R9_ARUDO
MAAPPGTAPFRAATCPSASSSPTAAGTPGSHSRSWAGTPWSSAAPRMAEEEAAAAAGSSAAGRRASSGPGTRCRCR